MPKTLRIANCSGFYGDRLSAAKEMVEGGEIDFLTGDYLAELTMMILFRDRLKDPSRGYARTFLTQMEQVLGQCADRNIKVISNAGGLNPMALAEEIEGLARKLGVAPKVAWIEGDEITERLDELQARGNPLVDGATGRPLSELDERVLCANAYLGAWPIVEALKRDADIVVCPRITDTALLVAPAAWHHNWKRDDWDRLASGIVAGHILECGTQCTGGNYAFFEEIESLESPGFPICEMDEDGSFTITKHENTGGLVSEGTVTAQLLYETTDARYLTPDAVARFDTIRLEEEGPDRVRVTGVKGEPPPETLKVAMLYLSGYRNSGSILLTGLDIEKKARIVEEEFWKLMGGKDSFDEARADLIDLTEPNPGSNAEAYARLRFAMRDRDPEKVGRRFFDKIVELALSSIPGFTVPTGLRKKASPCVSFWGALIPADEVEQVVVVDGVRIPVPHTQPTTETIAIEPEPIEIPPPPGGPTKPIPIGRVLGSRSGDKGGAATLGVWGTSAEAYSWAAEYLTVEKVRELIPEAEELRIERFLMPNIRSIGFLIDGLLGEGASASILIDPQAKSLGEYFRARFADVPEGLVFGE
ncbi:MAG: exopolyphosphatase [Gemmatimonadetes bacterium]|nr:exopolyphosphatase [Gemmatimonadota bacterium]